MHIWHCDCGVEPHLRKPGEMGEHPSPVLAFHASNGLAKYTWYVQQCHRGRLNRLQDLLIRHPSDEAALKSVKENPIKFPKWRSYSRIGILSEKSFKAPGMMLTACVEMCAPSINAGAKAEPEVM